MPISRVGRWTRRIPYGSRRDLLRTGVVNAKQKCRGRRIGGDTRLDIAPGDRAESAANMNPTLADMNRTGSPELVDAANSAARYWFFHR